MLEDRSAASQDGRQDGSANVTLLHRVQEGLTESRTAPSMRRCPCCGQPLRTGQRITTIHGTSVHVRCASTRSR
jgi:transposase